MVTVININFNIDFINLISVFYKGLNYIHLQITLQISYTITSFFIPLSINTLSCYNINYYCY